MDLLGLSGFLDRAARKASALPHRNDPDSEPDAIKLRWRRETVVQTVGLSQNAQVIDCQLTSDDFANIAKEA